MTYLRQADAAFSVNIPPGFQIVAGYFGGANAFRVWQRHEWAMFPGYKLPIYVPASPGNGPEDGREAVALLQELGVPAGAYMVLDMETRVDAEYVANFGAAVQSFYRVWVYGSFDTVFRNPPLNGYWVADYTTDMGVIDGILQAGHVRSVQFAADVSPGYDVSLTKLWTEGGMWK